MDNINRIVFRYLLSVQVEWITFIKNVRKQLVKIRCVFGLLIRTHKVIINNIVHLYKWLWAKVENKCMYY